MPSHDRRAAARRRAWGRGPIILRFEPLEGRELMATSAAALPEIVATSFNVTPNADWDQPVQASGTIANIGTAPIPPGAIAAIYASPTATVGASSLLVGIVSINAGLAPGATQNFSQTVTMPPSPLPNMTTASTQLWFGLDIDPQGVVPQQNPKLNKNQGVGLDEAPVTITAVPPSNLIGTVFNLNTTTATWGQTITITAQIQNNAQGDAPATRAKIVLTPNGEAPGTFDDISVGNINVPALAPFQTTNVVAQVTLPATPPPQLAGQSTFQITMVQDADHQASALVQPPTVQGAGQDTGSITITNGPLTTPVGVLPDLAAGTVTAPTTSLYWGDGFQVSTIVQNIGQAAAPAFNVAFLLTGTDGLSDSQAIYLGSALIAGGLAPGFSQTVTQDLTLPSRLPYGMTVGALSYGRIVAVLDPENLVNETFKNNNSAESAPVSLRIFGVDGNATVPTAAPVHANAPLPTGKVTAKPVSPPPPPPLAVVTKRQAANRAKVLKMSEAQLIKAQLALVKLQQARTTKAKAKAESNTLTAKLTSQVNNLTQIVKDLL
jgi:CARDB